MDMSLEIHDYYGLLVHIHSIANLPLQNFISKVRPREKTNVERNEQFLT